MEEWNFDYKIKSSMFEENINKEDNLYIKNINKLENIFKETSDEIFFENSKNNNENT